MVNAAANPNDQTAAANSLCATGSADGIKCSVVAQPGKHDWPFASRAFAAALPWMAGQLATPGLAELPLPAPPPQVQPLPPAAAPQSAPHLQTVAK